MKLWIIYSKVVLNPNKNNAISWMLDEATALDFDAEIIFTEDLLLEATHNEFKIYHKGVLTPFPDAALIRCYDIAMIKHLELAGVKTLNKSLALEHCLNKWTTHLLLTEANISTPRSFFSEHDVDFDVLKNLLSLPFIVKDDFGARGDQVFLVNNENEFNRALQRCVTPFYQEYIKSSYGRDVRVHVIDGEVVASVLRQSNHDFKSNFSQGADALLYVPNDKIKALAINSTNVLGLDFAGVDILFTENGYTVCEINGIPGFRTVGLTSKFNIPKAMMETIRRQI